ncbi:MAG: TraB/GumN family protein [Sphingomonas sp.]
MTRFPAIFTAPLALLLAVPAFAQAAPAPAPAAAPAATPASPVVAVDADPALWVVKDKDTTIYLFGTIHVLKPGLSWFDEAVKKAFDKSDQLVLEIPLPDPAKARDVVLPLALDTGGTPLSTKVPEAKRAAYVAALAKLGLQPAQLDPVLPWFAAVTMAQISVMKAGYSPDNGAEKQLDAAAQAQHKPVIGLETLQQQLGYFHDLPESDQMAFLLAGVDDIDKFDTDLKAMVDSWAHGQPEKLAELLNKDVDVQPNLYKVLLVNRNARWADWIDERLKQPGTIFIAVGAGHLAGKDSVQNQLAAKYHIKAERIKY